MIYAFLFVALVLILVLVVGICRAAGQADRHAEEWSARRQDRSGVA